MLWKDEGSNRNLRILRISHHPHSMSIERNHADWTRNSLRALVKVVLIMHQLFQKLLVSSGDAQRVGEPQYDKTDIQKVQCIAKAAYMMGTTTTVSESV